VEALIGAIYLDQGYETAKQFVSKWVISKLDFVLEHKLYLDPKTKFQEIVQEKQGITPSYRVLGEAGPDHNKEFTVGAYIGQELIAEGIGSSKQEAETAAAEAALHAKGWE
jgi:ribonuclease-3